MYRAATYLALQNNLTAEQVDDLLALLDQYPISFGRSEEGEQLVFVADVDITHPIRDNQVTNNVSWVAALAPVREKLVALQQEIAAEGHRYGWTRYWDGRPSTCRVEDLFGCFG